MANQNAVGVYQKENGYWEYRFVVVVDGKSIARKKCTDANGNKLKTKREAIKAREVAIASTKLEREKKPTISRRTVKELFAEFCRDGRKDRKYQTIRKQDSLWENHLCEKFGKKYVDEISVAEVNDYLAELYYVNGYSYQYVESFLKMFYLIFGQAYSRNYLEVDEYNKLCVNKDTRIKMPKLKSDDDTDIVSFSRLELATMDKYFEGTNAETAYLLGRYCGLRINECYGLKWENVNLENGTILIDRQMQYQEGVVKLVAPKTRNSKRTIYLNEFMRSYFQKLADQKKEDELRFSVHRKQNRKMIEDVDGKMIYSTDLVNCLPNGKIQTVNSMKYHSKEIKGRLGIDFKFHHLRHTYGTLMAEMNTPQHLLCDQMGHGNIHVTQRYYIAISQTGVEVLRNNLNKL